jgi:hypothetical protein
VTDQVWIGLGISGGIVLLFLIVFLAKRGGGKKSGPQKVCGGCQRVMLADWTKCLFCGWMPGARLDFTLGPMMGQKLQLTDEVTTIGSVAGNTVVLADPAVSKKHAGIRRVDGHFELADLGSTNGVYVNGHKVPKQRLGAGDVVRIGNTEAVFRVD